MDQNFHQSHSRSAAHLDFEWVVPEHVRACRPVASRIEPSFQWRVSTGSINGGPLPNSVTCLHSASLSSFSDPGRTFND
jgi:hypothetical protein